MTDEEAKAVLRDSLIRSLLEKDEIRYESMPLDELFDLYKVQVAGLVKVDGKWKRKK